MMHGSGANVLNPCYFYIGIEYLTLLIGFRSERRCGRVQIAVTVLMKES